VLSERVTRERLKRLLAEYGRVAIWTYFALFVLVLAGFALAIAWGVQVESGKGGAGVLGAAYVATKLSQPLRIAATLALTPIVARLLKRWGVGEGQESPGAEPERVARDNDVPQSPGERNDEVSGGANEVNGGAKEPRAPGERAPH
jgi:hypothetical protein